MSVITLTHAPHHCNLWGRALLVRSTLKSYPTSTERSNLATQMDSGGFQQGTMSLLSGNEFYQDSAAEWYKQ